MITSVAFALAHPERGWKRGVTIFGLALIMHGLVAVAECSRPRSADPPLEDGGSLHHDPDPI